MSKTNSSISRHLVNTMQSYLLLSAIFLLATPLTSPFFVKSPLGCVKPSMTRAFAQRSKGFGKPATSSPTKKGTSSTNTPTSPELATEAKAAVTIDENKTPNIANLSDSDRQDKILAGEERRRGAQARSAGEATGRDWYADWYAD